MSFGGFGELSQKKKTDLLFTEELSNENVGGVSSGGAGIISLEQKSDSETLLWRKKI